MSSSQPDDAKSVVLEIETAAEMGDPATDPVAYRRSLGQFATGVTVITARAGEMRVGMTANSFSSVSLDPPLVLWSIKQTSTSFNAFKAATHFVVNVLSIDQHHLSGHFGRSDADKFAGIGWSEGIDGAPLLHGVVATFECEKIAEFEGGDHLIMLGKVLRFSRYDREALLFVQGKYAVAAEHPGLEAKVIEKTGSSKPS